MKALLLPILTIAITGTTHIHATEKDVWYGASGEVVKVTPAEKKKQDYVPFWKKRELQRLTNQEARKNGRVRSRTSRYYRTYYPRYYGYSRYGSYYRGYGSRRYYSPSRVRFLGSYYGNGWSIRIHR